MPDDIQTLIGAAQYTEALKLAERACAANPDQPEPWLVKASIHAQMGDLAGIITACGHVIKLQPGHVPAHYNMAVALQSSGRGLEAIPHYQAVLASNPGHAASLINLGLLYRESGKPKEALPLLEQAVNRQPDFAAARNSLGLLYCDLGRHEEALEQFRTALQMQPGFLAASTNIARCFSLRGKTEQALAHLDQLLTQHPDFVDAHITKASLLGDIRNHDSAISQLQAALTLIPGDARLHYELAQRMVRSGRPDDAIQHYRAAININPGDFQSLNNLGALLHSLGRTGEGITLLHKAATINPESMQILINLCVLHAANGNDLKAQQHCLQALKLQPDRRDSLQRFAQIVSGAKRFVPSDDFQLALQTCFSRPDIDQQSLAPPALSLILSTKEITELCARCSRGETPPYEAFSILWEGNHAAILQRILTHTIIAKAEMEQCLRAYRRAALLHFSTADGQITRAPTQADLEQLIAVAHQCFNTEFVFEATDDEELRLSHLVLTEKETQTWITRILLAMYRPLPDTITRMDCSTLPGTSAELLSGLIKKQVINARREREIKEELQQITPISEGTSASVRDQYEESPYPRWLSLDIQTPRHYTTVLRESFPHFTPPDFGTGRIETLIAGCGTGKHAILSATRFANTSVTAIDLSRSSLAYGKRNAEELRVDNIEFYCGDILRLGGIDKSFHIIESVGVLHHLADPEQGLSILRSLLLPSGLMNLAFYSSLARQAVHAAREYLLTGNALPDLNGIRQARSKILSLPDEHPIRRVTEILDFYSLSDCRDLLFHTQETCYTLPEIAALLERNHLDFIGFELPDPRIKMRYLEQFPNDTRLTNLANWHLFEQEHPGTFIGMYSFWCQARSQEHNDSHTKPYNSGNL